MSAVGMRASRLILVEGLPGSGKSTTAQWLCHLLGAVGVDAVWYHEQDVHHPVYNYEQLQAVTCSGPAACEAYHAAARERWRDRVAAPSRGPVAIFDSSFLQSPVASMQLAGCSREAIAHHVAETERILAPLQPALILLAQPDSAEAYRHLRTRRGAAFEAFLLELVRATPYGEAADAASPEGILALLREHAALLDGFVDRAGMRSLRVDVSASRWSEYRLAIAAFLGVPLIDPHPAIGDVDRFAGRYCELDSDQELVVAVDERGLLLQPMGTRLLPRRGTTFELEGLAIELTFEDREGRDEGAERMLCAARLPNLGPVWVRAR